MNSESSIEMRSCSVAKRVQIVPGTRGDYNELARYHYRGGRLGPYVAVFAIRPDGILATQVGTNVIGVIVYTMPAPGLELRNIATANLFAGFDRATQLALINKNIRCISRVIIEPRFRGLGLASRLVRETMPQVGVPIVEAMAVMGLVNPFFEKAGMKVFTAKMPTRCVQLAEAFSLVGIEKEELIDSQKVQQKLDKLQKNEAEFVELQIRNFMQSYSKRRNMLPGLERTRYILSKLTERPLYYIWFNQGLELRIENQKSGIRQQDAGYDKHN